jgi:Uncharacterized conserved protein
MADPYDLQRFVRAQEHDYEEALSEIRSGRKRSHWMWYIFPQFDGLGVSPTSKRYAVKSVAEARRFSRIHCSGRVCGSAPRPPSASKAFPPRTSSAFRTT